jgi:WD40 repeat protein/serine/threonine protein kinase
MTSEQERFRLVEEIFHTVKDSPEAQWPAILARACGDDQALLADVKALLGNIGPTQHVLPTPQADPYVGKMIGPYRVVAVLDEGGMGMVYLADQTTPLRRRVAIKLIKMGMDTREVVRRFESERQTLAMMNHPGIAAVYDAGTEDNGHPYFVMEYVPGVSITSFCDKEHLAVEDRLRLMVQVCGAVQHAHQKGVIHRDLKPSNILVMLQDGKPIPKVIDFGIAKAIQHIGTQTVYTEQGKPIGTPEYMSPEQADMSPLDVDTRTDVYSLGVIMYELLTGMLPFDSQRLRHAGCAEMQRIIREEEPPRPSTRLKSVLADATAPGTVVPGYRGHADARTIHRQIQGDLDWITMKAIDKDRSRRYASASELAADVENYLDQRPVVAGPPGTIYPIRKFVRKHRGSVVAASLLILSIVSGLVCTSLLYYRAEKETVRAKAATVRADLERDTARKAEAAAQAAEHEATEKAESLRRMNYFCQIGLAQAAWNEEDAARMHELLQTCPDDLRGWEWSHLLWRSDRSLMTLGEEGIRGNTIAVDRGGSRFFSADDNGVVKEWTTGGDLVRSWSAHQGRIVTLALNPDSSVLATAGRDDRSLRLWNARTSQSIRTLSDDAPFICVTFSPAGERLYSGDEKQLVRCWDWRQGREDPGFRSSSAGWHVAVSPDGKTLAAADIRGGVRLLDAQSGSLIRELGAHKDRVMRIRFSPDGSRLASSGGDCTVGLWPMDPSLPGRLLYGHRHSLISVTFAPNGHDLISGSWDGTIKVWDADKGRCQRTLLGHKKGVFDLAFTAGQNLVSVSADGTVRMWNPYAEPDAETLDLEELGTPLAINRDGSRILFGRSNNDQALLSLYDLDTRKPQTTLRCPPVAQACFQPSGSFVALRSSAGKVVFWNTRDGNLEKPLDSQATVTAIRFDDTGQQLACGSSDGAVELWSVTPRQLACRLSGASAEITSTIFSPDHKMLIAGATDGTLVAWSIPQQTVVRKWNAHALGVTALQCSADGRLLWSAGRDSAVKVWNLISGECLQTHEVLRGYVQVFGSDPSGRIILWGGTDDTVRYCDAASSKEILTFTGHNRDIVLIGFSTLHDIILTVSSDGMVRIWRRQPGIQRMATAALAPLPPDQ